MPDEFMMVKNDELDGNVLVDNGFGADSDEESDTLMTTLVDLPTQGTLVGGLLATTVRRRFASGVFTGELDGAACATPSGLVARGTSHTRNRTSRVAGKGRGRRSRRASSSAKEEA